LGFNGLNGERLMKMDKRLREVNFGEDEGKVFDALS
jgi:hypothetical protein